ncbi:MrcB family domain-containing protein [Streptomyces sp. NPDC051018]|uniref:MrcB family domain-containing protein n=1 Tax=Streptomyces sp. NPDC051018 TaxID=3365639 RepID=UPI003793170A
MDMRDLLLQVAAQYDRTAGTKQHVPGQKLLRSVGRRKDLILPQGYRAIGRGGQGTPAATPWIGVLDPLVTNDPKRGLYLAYIFGADLASVTLTLQQGVTRLEDRLGKGDALREHLTRRSSELRRRLPQKKMQRWLHSPSFGDSGVKPRAYEASSVCARRYDIPDLPPEDELQDDLSQAMELLQQAAAAEKLLLVEEGKSLLSAGYEGGSHGMSDPLSGFHPKDSRSYIAKIAAKQQIKSRDHERLIKGFGPYILSRGYIPTTERAHPKDLVLRLAGNSPDEGPQWLVEAKVVRAGNSTTAVREAVGQLKEYSFFLYRERGLALPHLLALFTEDVGVYSRYLEDAGIASIWQSGDEWQGSTRAIEWNMVG